MKSRLLTLCAGLAFLTAGNFSGNAQTVSTFENLALSPNSYWDGSSAPNGTSFNSGNGIFPNDYNSSFFYWQSGWAYSDMQDSTTAGFTNMFSARTAIGYAGSANYAVGQQDATVRLSGMAFGNVVNGFYVTNSTYAAISMRDGDQFAKQFGGVTGNDTDWFKLTIRKYVGGVLTNDSVEFYLADYRFTNNTQDYIVKNWQWVDLTSLGNVDSLLFHLSSTDVGQFGMNTPAFFCMDNFTTADSPLLTAEIKNNKLFFTLFPNPANDNINLNLEKINSDGALVQILDETGRIVYSEMIHSATAQLSVMDLSDGIYTLRVISDNFAGSKLFMKK